MKFFAGFIFMVCFFTSVYSQPTAPGIAANKQQEEFSQEYEKFLKQLRQINPQATLLCTVGLMGERIYDAVEKAVLKYKENTGDHKIYAIKLKEQLPQDGLVTSGHPTEISHTKAAAVLVENIKKIMNW